MVSAVSMVLLPACSISAAFTVRFLIAGGGAACPQQERHLPPGLPLPLHHLPALQRQRAAMQRQGHVLHQHRRVPVLHWLWRS